MKSRHGGDFPRPAGLGDDWLLSGAWPLPRPDGGEDSLTRSAPIQPSLRRPHTTPMNDPSALKPRVLALMLAKTGPSLQPERNPQRLRQDAAGKRWSDARSRNWSTSARSIRLHKKPLYALAKAASVVSGVVQGHPDGFGFVVPDQKGMEDIYLSRREMRRVMHGDRVLVRPEKKRHGGQPGTRGGGAGTGAAPPGGRGADRRRPHPGGAHGPARRAGDSRCRRPRRPLQPGQVAAVEMTRYGGGYTPAGGAAGTGAGIAPDDPEVQARAVIFRYGLARGLLERGPSGRRSAMAPRRGFQASPAGRRDLRGLTTFTVDGETARDFDDAVEPGARPPAKRLRGSTSPSPTWAALRAARTPPSTSRPTRTRHQRVLPGPCPAHAAAGAVHRYLQPQARSGPARAHGAPADRPQGRRGRTGGDLPAP